MEAISGTVDGGVHRLPVRIYYEDTDFSGVVYHANYLKYFERGRSEYMRLTGIHHHELAALETPLAFAVAEITIRYLAPVRIDQLITVCSQVMGVRGASFDIDQWVELDGKRCAEGRVHVVCIDMNGRPRRMPKPMTDAVKACVVPAS